MGWYYYLENKLSFPFQAKCIASKITSPLKKGEDVEVLGMASEDACAKDMLVLVRWQSRKPAVPLVQLTAVNPDNSTVKAIGSEQVEFSGIIYAHQLRTTIGQMVSDLELIVLATSPEEWQGRIEYLPIARVE